MIITNKIKIRIFLWLILVFIVGWLFCMAIVPSGQIVYTNNFLKRNDFVGKITPAERIKYSENGKPVVIGDPVYFSMRTLRKFDKAKVFLKYKTNEAAPNIIELGILMGGAVKQYDLKPIENKIIDKLSLVWSSVKNNDLILFQKDNKYGSVEDFLDNLPETEKLAVYHYDLNYDYILPEYKKIDEVYSLEIALRGIWQTYTYIKDETLDFSFEFLDINENKDADIIELFLYYNGNLIDSRLLEDDGIASDSGEILESRKLSLQLENLPEGAYKLELRVNDDIITKNIQTKQSKLAFINRLKLYKNNKNNIIFYTDSKKVQAATIYSDSLQKLKLGENILNLEETFKQFEGSVKASSSSSFGKIILEKDGIIISGDGNFSFEENSFINPKIKKVNNVIDIKHDNIEYILTSYQAAQQIEEWKVAEIDFDISSAYREEGAYGFVISVPGLEVEDGVGLEIDEIKIQLNGKSLIEKLTEIIN